MVKFASSSSGQPLYDQLCELLKKKMDEEFVSGEMLPTERKLSILYGVSRTTVRIALQKLEQLGYVEREQGKGTFVSYAKNIKQENYSENSFDNHVKHLGKDPSSKLLKLELVDCGPELAKHFNISSAEKLLKIETIRLADKEPILLETTFLVYESFKDIDLTRFEKEKTQTIFDKKYENEVSYVQDKINVIKPGDKLTDLLHIDSTTPILQAKRSYFNKKNVLLELIISHARADKFEYNISYRE